MSVLGSTKGSADTTSADPAIQGGRYDRYVSWCDAQHLDPDDDANLEQFDIECDIAIVNAGLARREDEEWT